MSNDKSVRDRPLVIYAALYLPFFRFHFADIDRPSKIDPQSARTAIRAKSEIHSKRISECIKCESSAFFFRVGSGKFMMRHHQLRILYFSRFDSFRSSFVRCSALAPRSPPRDSCSPEVFIAHSVQRCISTCFSLLFSCARSLQPPLPRANDVHLLINRTELCLRNDAH